MYDYDYGDYDGDREDARYERGDRHYRYSCGDATCGAPDCGDCRTDDEEEEEEEEEEEDDDDDAP